MNRRSRQRHAQARDIDGLRVRIRQATTADLIAKPDTTADDPTPDTDAA